MYESIASFVDKNRKAWKVSELNRLLFAEEYKRSRFLSEPIRQFDVETRNKLKEMYRHEEEEDAGATRPHSAGAKKSLRTVTRDQFPFGKHHKKVMRVDYNRAQAERGRGSLSWLHGSLVHGNKRKSLVAKPPRRRRMPEEE